MRAQDGAAASSRQRLGQTAPALLEQPRLVQHRLNPLQLRLEMRIAAGRGRQSRP